MLFSIVKVGILTWASMGHDSPRVAAAGTIIFSTYTLSSFFGSGSCWLAWADRPLVPSIKKDC